MCRFMGCRSILSGPAGGVVGYAATSYHEQHDVPSVPYGSPPSTVHTAQLYKTPVIGFDMGGTSTDVSRYSGSFEHVFESSIAGITLQSPQVISV